MQSVELVNGKKMVNGLRLCVEERGAFLGIIDTQLKLDVQALFWENPSVDTGRPFWVVSGGLIEVDWGALLTSSNPR